MGCHALLQGMFLIQGSNVCLLLWQADSLPLSHQFIAILLIEGSCREKHQLNCKTELIHGDNGFRAALDPSPRLYKAKKVGPYLNTSLNKHLKLGSKAVI